MQRQSRPHPPCQHRDDGQSKPCAGRGVRDIAGTREALGKGGQIGGAHSGTVVDYTQRDATKLIAADNPN